MLRYQRSMKTHSRSITLEEVNENVLNLKKEMDEIKELIGENSLELAFEVKSRIGESRKRSISEFKTQEEIERKFL